MESAPALDSTGHHHLLPQEIRIFLDFAEREARASRREMIDIPPKPIIICTECRGRLKKVLDQDILHVWKQRDRVIQLLEKNEGLTASEILRLEESMVKQDLKLGFIENEITGWKLAAEEYLAGKKLILGENQDLRDANAFIRRYQEAIRGHRGRSSRPDREIQEQAARFLATLVVGGPAVLGDEGFQRRNRNEDLRISYGYHNNFEVPLNGKN